MPLNREEGNSGGMPEEPIQKQSPGLGKSQKIAVASLAVFALFIMVMWTVQFKKGLSEPFVYKGPADSGAENTSACSGPDCPATIEALKGKDTDKDGLNDYDELYVHKTSAYLEDSDSDGISDKKEIDANKDPNCPEGKECYQSPLVNSETGTEINSGATGQDNEALSEMLKQYGATDPGVLQTPSTANGSSSPASAQNSLNQSDSGLAQALASGQLDAKSLRELLVQYGMNEQALAGISDEQLMKSFGEVISQSQ
ncbi:MAG: hypothetical protein WC745_05190 [Patescibacteria group bacterium]|jgi:hypothetical protein